MRKTPPIIAFLERYKLQLFISVAVLIGLILGRYVISQIRLTQANKTSVAFEQNIQNSPKAYRTFYVKSKSHEQELILFKNYRFKCQEYHFVYKNSLIAEGEWSIDKDRAQIILDLDETSCSRMGKVESCWKDVYAWNFCVDPREHECQNTLKIISPQQIEFNYLDLEEGSRRN